MNLLLGAIVLLVALWAAIAAFLMVRRGLSAHQALVYTPLKIGCGISDSQARQLRKAERPVVYAIVQTSPVDVAAALSLLPPETLHILDESSARSPWLEPFREMARSIAFNAEHIFVSRRLVRHLKGRGRLAVYFPQTPEPDAKTFRLYRAVARIAQAAGAEVMPMVISRRGGPIIRRQAVCLPAMSVAELQQRAGIASVRASNALFDRVAEARLAAARPDRTVFAAVANAADRDRSFGPAVTDAIGAALSTRDLLRAAHVLARRVDALGPRGEAVGLMLPNSAGMACAFLGLQSAARPTVMINYTAGTANIVSALRTAELRRVVSSKAFIEKAQLGDIVDAIAATGTRIVWLEDLHASVTVADRVLAALSWRRPLVRANPDNPAVILFTSGSEGEPKGVALSHRNLVTNALQVTARLALSPADSLLNVLPTFHCFGLTGGIVLPLLAGVRLDLYPSPLHYRIIPKVAARTRPTIMVGTDTFLANYAKAADDADFSSLRLVVAGAEPVREETRSLWRNRFGAEIMEGFGMTEAAPVVALNTATHSRPGSVGRLLPGVLAKIEPVDGIAAGGRLLISGPNLMLGYMTADRPGEIQLREGRWHDTGDIAEFDREGFLWVRGRARRFAKIAGEMVSLGAAEILAARLWPEDRHAVVAVPDPRRGEKLVLVTTAQSAERGALSRFGRKSGAADLAVPDAIVRVEDLPVLGTGKTDYARATQLALATLGLDKAA